MEQQKKSPDTEALFARAYQIFLSERSDDALREFTAYLLRRQDDIRAWLAMASIYIRKFDWDSAREAYREAMKYQPDDAVGYNLRSYVRYNLQMPEEALADVERALQLDPNYFMAWNNKAVFCHNAGRLDEAKAAYERALDISPLFIAALRHLCGLHKFKKDDAVYKRLAFVEDNRHHLPPLQQAHLEYCRGKYFKDIGEHEKSFDAFATGASILHGLNPYDHEQTLTNFGMVKACFPEKIRWPEAKKSATPVPIFIVGMPRSGSTLVEQILASHPLVHGGGELRLMPHLIGDLRQYSNFAVNFETKLEDMQERGRKYLDELQKLATDSAYVTDKLPYNFRNLGFIRLMLPQAKIIHTLRDPMDIGLSCFTTLFTEKHEWSYHLRDLALYYHAYHDIMEHWKKTLPPGSILDVRYETLVEKPEETVRAMLDHCELEWDARCLDFHSTGRAVNTASNIQVRQPLYKSSVGRWRKHEESLTALKQGLGPLFEDN